MLRVKEDYDLEILKDFGFEFDRGTTYIKQFEHEDTYISVSECDLGVLNISFDVFSSDDEINQVVDTIYLLTKELVVERI